MRFINSFINLISKNKKIIICLLIIYIIHKLIYNNRESFIDNKEQIFANNKFDNVILPKKNNYDIEIAIPAGQVLHSTIQGNWGLARDYNGKGFTTGIYRDGYSADGSIFRGKSGKVYKRMLEQGPYVLKYEIRQAYDEDKIKKTKQSWDVKVYVNNKLIHTCLDEGIPSDKIRVLGTNYAEFNELAKGNGRGRREVDYVKFIPKDVEGFENNEKGCDFTKKPYSQVGGSFSKYRNMKCTERTPKICKRQPPCREDAINRGKPTPEETGSVKKYGKKAMEKPSWTAFRKNMLKEKGVDVRHRLWDPNTLYIDRDKAPNIYRLIPYTGKNVWRTFQSPNGNATGWKIKSGMYIFQWSYEHPQFPWKDLYEECRDYKCTVKKPLCPQSSNYDYVKLSPNQGSRSKHERCCPIYKCEYNFDHDTNECRTEGDKKICNSYEVQKVIYNERNDGKSLKEGFTEGFTEYVNRQQPSMDEINDNWSIQTLRSGKPENEQLNDGERTGMLTEWECKTIAASRNATLSDNDIKGWNQMPTGCLIVKNNKGKKDWKYNKKKTTKKCKNKWNCIVGIDPKFAATASGKGKDGKDGKSGIDGQDGGDGRDGRDGTSGVDGAAGRDGDQGARGQRGDSGAMGAAGARGLSGSQGPRGKKGIRGEQGAPGPRGPPGKSMTMDLPTIKVKDDKPNADSINVTACESWQKHHTKDTFGVWTADSSDAASYPSGCFIYQKNHVRFNKNPSSEDVKCDANPKVTACLQRSSKGFKGEPGPMGEAGPRGADGTPGKPGERGEPGLKGDRGEPGLRGAPGKDGEAIGKPGPRGKDGRDGPVGKTGPAGTPGVKGDRGEKGDTGFRGPRGRTGRSIKGAPGAPAKSELRVLNINADAQSSHFYDDEGNSIISHNDTNEKINLESQKLNVLIVQKNTAVEDLTKHKEEIDNARKNYYKNIDKKQALEMIQIRKKQLEDKRVQILKLDELVKKQQRRVALAAMGGVRAKDELLKMEVERKLNEENFNKLQVKLHEERQKQKEKRDRERRKLVSQPKIIGQSAGSLIPGGEFGNPSGPASLTEVENQFGKKGKTCPKGCMLSDKINEYCKDEIIEQIIDGRKRYVRACPSTCIGPDDPRYVDYKNQPLLKDKICTDTVAHCVENCQGSWIETDNKGSGILSSKQFVSKMTQPKQFATKQTNNMFQNNIVDPSSLKELLGRKNDVQMVDTYPGQPKGRKFLGQVKTAYQKNYRPLDPNPSHGPKAMNALFTSLF